jgi:hypothetical protein
MRIEKIILEGACGFPTRSSVPHVPPLLTVCFGRLQDIRETDGCDAAFGVLTLFASPLRSLNFGARLVGLRRASCISLQGPPTRGRLLERSKDLRFVSLSTFALVARALGMGMWVAEHAGAPCAAC